MQGEGGFFYRGCVFAFSVIWVADRFAHLDCLERGAFLGDCFYRRSRDSRRYAI